MKKLLGFIRLHRVISTIIIIVAGLIIYGTTITLKSVYGNGFKRTFTGKYEEILFCEDGTYSLIGKNCIKKESIGDYKVPTYEDINPHEDWGISWNYLSKEYHGVPYSYFASDEPLELDFEHRDECNNFFPIEFKEEDGKKIPISYRCTVLPSGTKAVCPKGYVLIEDENEYDDHDIMCIGENNIKEPNVYRMPVYEITGVTNDKYGRPCEDKSLLEDEFEACIDAVDFAERELEIIDSKTKQKGDYCRSISITESGTVLMQCFSNNVDIIRKYETDVLFVGVKKSNSYFGKYFYNIDVSPKKALDNLK